MRCASPLLFVSAAVALGLSGCTRTTLQGGQIDLVPAGFAYAPDCESHGGLRFGHRPLSQRCWFTGGDPPSSIVVTELEGVVTAGELEAEHARETGRRQSWLKLEPIETLEVDGRPAWGWYDSVVTGERVSGVGYTAVVPYSDRTWVVSFSGRRARDLDRGLARATATSFVVRRSGQLDIRKLVVFLGLVAAGLGVWSYLRRVEAVPPPPRGGPPTLRERKASTPPREVPKNRKG